MNDNNLENRKRAERLAEVLDALKAQGFKQSHVARELGIPPNYLSDLRNYQRVITEPLARTIGSMYGVSFQWMWCGEGAQCTPKIRAEGIPLNESLTLPILTELHVGESRASKAWDGSVIVLSGRAAAEASAAVMPYIMRMAFNDKTGRLKKGDLILITQERSASTGIAVIQTAKRLLLARRRGRGWQSVDTGRVASGNPDVVGRTLGIVWATL